MKPNNCRSWDIDNHPNSKSEALNTKQAPIFKYQNLKHLQTHISKFKRKQESIQRGFEHWDLEFRYCLELRVSDLVFRRKQ